MSTDWFKMNPEARFFSLITSLNHEARNLSLARIIGKEPKTFLDMQKSFQSTFGDIEGIHIPDRYDFQSYCLSTLEPNGFVRRVENSDSIYATTWAITDAGNAIGKQSAAHALAISSKYNFSLYKVLGKAGRHGDTSAPYNSSRLLIALQHKPKPVTVLMDNLKISRPNIVNNLKRLESFGLVEYDSLGNEDDMSASFSWNRGDPSQVQPIYGAKKLTKMISNVVYESTRPLKKEDILDMVNSSSEKRYTLNHVGKT